MPRPRAPRPTLSSTASAGSPDRSGGCFDLRRAPLQGGRYDPPTLGPRQSIDFEGIGVDGSRVRIGSRTYERIGMDEVRAIMDEGAAVADVPEPLELVDAGDGKTGGVEAERPNFFGIKATGKRICFICDGSGSMTGYFDQLKRELVDLVRRLPSGTRFIVLFF